jgi:hypothetical protein
MCKVAAALHSTKGLGRVLTWTLRHLAFTSSDPAQCNIDTVSASCWLVDISEAVKEG